MTKRIHYSRDLIFQEQYFPYSHISTSNTVLPNNIFLHPIIPNYQAFVDPPFLDVPNVSISHPPTSSSDQFTSSTASTSTPSATIITQHTPPPNTVEASRQQPQQQLRRSLRVSRPPSNLQDYMCPSSSHQKAALPTTTHWFNVVHFFTLTSSQQ